MEIPATMPTARSKFSNVISHQRHRVTRLRDSQAQITQLGPRNNQCATLPDIEIGPFETFFRSSLANQRPITATDCVCDSMCGELGALLLTNRWFCTNERKDDPRSSDRQSRVFLQSGKKSCIRAGQNSLLLTKWMLYSYRVVQCDFQPGMKRH